MRVCSVRTSGGPRYPIIVIITRVIIVGNRIRARVLGEFFFRLLPSGAAKVSHRSSPRIGARVQPRVGCSPLARHPAAPVPFFRGFARRCSAKTTGGKKKRKRKRINSKKKTASEKAECTRVVREERRNVYNTILLRVIDLKTERRRRRCAERILRVCSPRRVLFLIRARANE